MAQTKAELYGKHGNSKGWLADALRVEELPPQGSVDADHYLRASTITHCIFMGTKAWTWQRAKKSQALGCTVFCMGQGEKQKPLGFPPHSVFGQVTTLSLSSISPII